MVYSIYVRISTLGVLQYLLFPSAPYPLYVSPEGACNTRYIVICCVVLFTAVCLVLSSGVCWCSMYRAVAASWQRRRMRTLSSPGELA